MVSARQREGASRALVGARACEGVGVPAGSSVNAGTQGSGTVSVGSAPFSSMLWVTNQVDAKWEPVAAAFDATRGDLGLFIPCSD